MLQGFVSTAFVVGTLLTTLMPATGLARDHDDYSRGRRGGDRYSRGRGLVSPHGYDGWREHFAPSSYGRPVYRGRYNGGFYLGYSALLTGTLTIPATPTRLLRRRATVSINSSIRRRTRRNSSISRGIGSRSRTTIRINRSFPSNNISSNINPTLARVH